MRTPLLAVDIIILVNGEVALIRRKNPPFRGCYALPGGFVELGESTEDAARREGVEETGLELETLRLVGVYSDPGRDPRGHVVSVCYLAKGKGAIRAGSDARSAEIFPMDALPELAFDHQRMISDSQALVESG